MSQDSDIDFEVVVVGCGVAGTAAAASAAEKAKSLGKQARILILERSEPQHRGGNSRWTGAYLRMQDIHTPAENFAEDLISFSGGLANKEYVKCLVEKAGETLSWVRDKGVEFEKTTFLASLAKNKPRMTPVGGGRAILDSLARAAEAMGAVIAYKTTAWRLSLADDGRINGLWTRDADGHATLIRTHAVILACGGFEGNAEMMTQYIGKSAYTIPTVAPGGRYNKGEGIRMALEIGAKGEGQWDAIHAEPVDPRSGREEAVVQTYPYSILVGTDGKRFLDEGSATVDLTFEPVARKIFELPGNIAYVITDQKMYDLPNYELAVQTNIPPFQAETIEELASKIGIVPSELKSTIDTFNRAIQPSQFDPTRLDGKCTIGITPSKSNWAIPIDRPPFLAYPLVCSNVFTLGGLATDTDGRVLSADNYPIPGLYAAGEITGLYYGLYLGATSVLRGMVFGRIAGDHAMGRALDKA